MTRLQFEKTGNGVWISHLDLMRLFQRAFKRGGLTLKHTQGFSPRALVSIALPLSVGVESVCEILDYELEGQSISHEEIVERLNATMPEGIRVLKSYDSNYKIKNLSHLRCTVTMEYDAGVPEGAEDAIRQLFAANALLLEKRGKNGIVEQDIIPMIKSLQLSAGENELILDAVICAQNPTLNPAQLTAAIERYLPQYRCDHAIVRREQTLFPDGTEFS